LLTPLWLVGSAALASETVPAGPYEITTEIGMPHLEENLRYATVRERRCLNHEELALAFPILADELLQGCALRDECRSADGVFYALTCEGGNRPPERRTGDLASIGSTASWTSDSAART
jgi:hypothetical protein